MIQPRTILKVLDNSGAKTVRCIKITKGFKKKYAKLGDIIIVSVQQLRNKLKKSSKVKKKEIYKAIILGTKTGYHNNGLYVKFQENVVILINIQKEIIGTRILYPIPFILKKKKYQKLVSISQGLI
jgi:large subunit ribosomal protein L14